MGMPAARITDSHVCPMVTGIVPHVGGPIITGMPTVLTGTMPQARVTDMAVCVGPPDMIIKGSATVLVGGMPAARILDTTVHGGMIITGLPTVLIGDAGAAGGMVANIAAPGTPSVAQPTSVGQVMQLPQTEPGPKTPLGVPASQLPPHLEPAQPAPLTAPAPPLSEPIKAPQPLLRPSFGGLLARALVGLGAIAAGIATFFYPSQTAGPELDKGETKAAECKALANKLRNQVDDPDGALDNIVSLASNPDEADEVLKLLKRIDAESGSQPPKFAGRPTLKITRDEQDTIRSSGIFPDDPPPDALPQGGPVRIRQIGSQQKGHEFREGMEQGAYTSESTDRASNAVLRSWNNPMDIQEVQVLPKGSVILRGPAAPMTEKQHSGAMSRDVPPETLKGGATQIAHLGQIDSTTGKVSATAAQRKVKGPVSDVWH